MVEKPTFTDFIKRTYDRKFQSVFTATLGPNQSGKTDFILRQMEVLHELGLGDGFGANIPDLEAPFHIDFIEDFQTLKNHCTMLNPDPNKTGIKRYFFLADEMGNWAPKDQPWLNVRFIQELQQVRKYGLSMLASAIDRIDSRILNEKHFHGVFEKVSKSRPQLAIYRDWFNRRLVRLYNIQRTSIKFDTWHSANFYMEPQLNEAAIIPLNPEHKIALKYLDSDSWRKADIHPQEGKRAIKKVLAYHFKHCLHSIQQDTQEIISPTISDDD